MMRVAAVGKRAGRLYVRDFAVSSTDAVDLATRGWLRCGCADVGAVEEILTLLV